MAYEKCCLTGRFPPSEVNYCPGFVNWHSQRLSANGILARFRRIASPVDKVVDLNECGLTILVPLRWLGPSSIWSPFLRGKGLGVRFLIFSGALP